MLLKHPYHPKQSTDSRTDGRTGAKAEAPVPWPPDAKS